MSKLEVDVIEPQSGTTLTLGASGDTVTIPSGATFDASSGSLAGTLTTAAQPNITSVGTLTSFASTGIDDNATSTAITINSSENVGIGTTSPSARLHILNDQGGANGRILIDANVSNGYDTRIDQTDTGFEFTSVSDSRPIIFNTGSTPSERMQIDGSGNVGIGTASPATKLDVNGGLNCGFLQSSSSIYATSGIFRSSDGSAATPSMQPGVDADTGFFRAASNEIGFSTAGSEAMRIDSSGNLGIGVSSFSGNRLRVRGEGATSATTAFRAENSGGNIVFLGRNDGRIFTGTLSNSPYNLTTGSSANLFVSSGGVLFRSTSSLRYKTEIQDATYGLDDVMNLRSVTYKSINDGDKVFGGLIAEEVHEAGLTEFVEYNDEGNPDALHYGNMVSLAFKAIQELKADNDALRARIEALENA